MRTQNENKENIKEKYITRTITWWTGIEVKANYETMQFEQAPFIVYDELEIPRGRAKDVVKHEQLLRMKLSDFIRQAEVVEK